MTKLLDLGAVYVDISDGEKPLVKFIMSAEQCLENQRLSLGYAKNTIEEIQEFMEWEERLLKENMGLPKKNC